MKKRLKIFAFLLIFTSAASLSFADNYLDFSAVLNLFNEHFPEDNYQRSQLGLHTGIAYHFFPSNSNFSLGTQLTIGTSFPMTERILRESMSARASSIFDLRIVCAPSYSIPLGSIFYFHMSLGPIFIYTNEKTSERLVSGSTDYTYNAITGGLQASTAFLLITSRGFLLRTGISMDSLLLRAEKGEMRMNYRTTHNSQFKGVRYYSFNFDFLFCLGFKF